MNLVRFWFYKSEIKKIESNRIQIKKKKVKSEKIELNKKNRAKLNQTGMYCFESIFILK
jgi:hypothetical protein